MIGDTINHPSDTSLVHELNERGMSLQDDDTASMKSYGSHKNRMFKDESHKGSAETLDGEEKRHLSHEDRLDMDGGRVAPTFGSVFFSPIAFIFPLYFPRFIG